MLKSLSIRNVVLIDKLDIDFPRGFSVLSGETGAGKSILLDAVGLLLGRRAEVGMIRHGCDKLVITGCFETEDADGAMARLCAENDIDFNREILIKRSLDINGKSKIFFNDEPVTLKFLKEVAAYLVEIHGQFDNQGLLNQATHMEVLDNYGDYKNDLEKLHTCWCVYKNTIALLAKAEKQYAEAQQDEENLRHWVDEFAKIKPRENELTDLEDKRRQMMNAEKIIENLSAAGNALDMPQSVASCLRQAQTAVARVNAMLHDKYATLYEVLDTALINVTEAQDEIATAVNEVNLNQNDLDSIEERLFKLKSLARKHQTTVEELPQLWREMEQKLAGLSTGADNLQKLREDCAAAKQNYVKIAQQVSGLRKAVALRLDAKIGAELPDLKMAKARFVTKIEVKPENAWSENGVDDVCFLVTTNQGQPLGALNKIASGGELARFMLAIKVNLAQTSQIETMIFDEVDTGVGGATAQAVGEKLAKLGQKAQVLVVTHSPQVAAQSRHHFKVEKNTVDNLTTTTVRQLNDFEKQEEIARMLSGEQISDEARAAAKVLIGA